eukprot:14343685-Heterocapsa_arctica.AAC.1
MDPEAVTIIGCRRGYSPTVMYMGIIMHLATMVLKCQGFWYIGLIGSLLSKAYWQGVCSRWHGLECICSTCLKRSIRTSSPAPFTRGSTIFGKGRADPAPPYCATWQMLPLVWSEALR